MHASRTGAERATRPGGREDHDEYVTTEADERASGFPQAGTPTPDICHDAWEGVGSGVTMADLQGGDCAVVVYREDDSWEAGVLPVALTGDLEGLVHALRQQPSRGGTIGLVAVGDDFFLVLRVFGDSVRLFLSDVTASIDWRLAREAVDYLGLPVPEDEDLDQVLPAGDMSIFADLGMDEMELGALAGDLDLYPDEGLSSIAERLGFAEPFERALDAAMG